MDEEAHFGLQADAEAGHVRAVIRNVRLGLRREGVMGVGSFNHLCVFIFAQIKVSLSVTE